MSLATAFKAFADNLFVSEERSGLKQSASWLTSILTGGRENYSGVDVNESTAMQLGAVSACINVISNGIAATSLKPFITESGKTSEAIKHPTYELLTLRPNENMTAFTFIHLLQSQVLRWGNGYAWIELDGKGFPVAIWPLLAELTKPYNLDGEIIYESTINGRMFRFRSDQIIHIKAMSTDGLVGISPIRQHAEEMGIQIAAQNFGAEFFGNGAIVQGVLEYPGNLDGPAKEAIKNSWSRATSGSGNRHQTPVLSGGMKYQKVGIPPEEAQFLETRQYGDRKIAQIYNVPPHMIADLKDATFSNITEETMNFLRKTLNPWFTQWKQELGYKLFSRNERKRYTASFDKSEILEGTPKDEAEKDVKLVNMGIISRNEARKRRNMNPVDGLDEILIPLNMIEMKDVPEESTSGDGERKINVEPLFKRFVDLFSTAQKNVGNRDGAIDKWVNDASEKIIRRNLGPITESLNRPDILESFLNQYRKVANTPDQVTDEIVMCTLKGLYDGD